MTEKEAASRKALNRIGTTWPNGWTRLLADEYHRALHDITPNVLDHACGEAIATRTTRPAPAQLRELAEHHLDELERRRRAVDRPDDGNGCPRCREDPDGERLRELWRGDGKMIRCPAHNWSWQGTGRNPYRDLDDAHARGEDDPVEPLPHDVWRELALQGSFGEVIRRVAQAGGTPADVLRAVA